MFGPRPRRASAHLGVVGHIELLRHLRCCPVLVEAAQAGEVCSRQIAGVRGNNESVGVGGVGDHHHLGGGGVEGGEEGVRRRKENRERRKEKEEKRKSQEKR